MNLTLLHLKRIQDNRPLSILINTLKFTVSLLFIIFVFVWANNNVSFIKRYDFYTIRTDSMEPVIKVDDLVVVNHDFDINSIQPGDIVAFNVDLNRDDIDEVVIHYMYARTTIDGEEYIQTISEISDNVDPWNLEHEKIIGVYKFHLRGIGRIFEFGSSTIGRVVILIDVILVSLLFDLIGEPKKKNSKNKK